METNKILIGSHVGMNGPSYFVGSVKDALKCSDDSLVEDLPLIKQVKKNKKIDTELKKDIEKAKYEAKSDKVKPNYKKKVKLAVDKVKRKHRREIIKKDIRRQREERYKQNGNK